MDVVRRLDEHAWREFVDHHPQGNIFHTPEMFQVFARTSGYRPSLWAVAGRHGQVLALLLPVQITVLHRWLRPLTTRAVVYGSVLCARGAEGQGALARLLRAYVQETRGSLLFTELRNLSSLEGLQPILDEHDFVYEDHLNYLVDLKRPPEAILQGIRRRTRKRIRRGLRRQEVSVGEVTGREQVEACYALLQRTYRAARVPLADPSLFEAAFDLLYPKGMIRFSLASVGQTPVAASVDLCYKDVVLGWYGGMDRAYAPYHPNELLTWHILMWGAENGYATYDFGGAGKPGKVYGVRNFKAKFGGELVCFGRNIYVHRPRFLHLSRLGYHIYRRLAGEPFRKNGAITPAVREDGSAGEVVGAHPSHPD
jgi:CelD/BcsL family acetyltransferase involved in cellulose biosynthesis